MITDETKSQSVCTVHLVHFHTVWCMLWILYYSIFLHPLVKQLNSTQLATL